MCAIKAKVTAKATEKDRDEVYDLKVLFIEGEEAWSAQCLEYDIAAQAETLNELFYEFERVIVSQITVDEELGRKPFEGINRAPKEFWDAFSRSQTRMDRPIAGLKTSEAKQPTILPTIRVAERAA